MNDILKLKSGKELYINRGLISINDNLEIEQGYDSGLPAAPCHSNYRYDDERMTKEEALELADIMIRRWIKFKKACQK